MKKPTLKGNVAPYFPPVAQVTCVMQNEVVCASLETYHDVIDIDEESWTDF